MNERIKLLAEQASLYARSDNSSMLFENYHNRYTDKFAELIVRECADIAADQSAIRPEYRIKKHFGVDI